MKRNVQERINIKSKFATWNVSGLREKEKELADEIRKSGIAIVALTETKKKERGKQLLPSGDLLIYSGVDENKRASAGVACFIRESFINKIAGWKHIC